MIISLGNWQELCTFVPKCAKNLAFSTRFELLTQCLTTNWVWSLSKLCSVQHCKAGWARPVFSILGKDKRDPNETVFCSLDVSQGLHFKAVQSNRSYGIWDCFYLNEPLENMQKHRVLSSVASPNPQGIDPRPGSWGEKKVLGSAGNHVFWGISWYFTGKMPFQYQLPFK